MTDMCIMCDGASRDEALFSLHGSVLIYGWGIQYVETADPDKTWAYTIGLSSNYEHPELAVVGESQDVAGYVLNRIGDMVSKGQTFAGGDRLPDSCGRGIYLAWVHPTQFDHGTFAVWEDYYESSAVRYPSGPCSRSFSVPANRSSTSQTPGPASIKPLTSSRKGWSMGVAVAA